MSSWPPSFLPSTTIASSLAATTNAIASNVTGNRLFRHGEEANNRFTHSAGVILISSNTDDDDDETRNEPSYDLTPTPLLLLLASAFSLFPSSLFMSHSEEFFPSLISTMAGDQWE